MEKKIMNINQLSDYTGIKISTLRSYRLKKSIPFIKVNCLLLFDKCEIDKWLDERKVDALA